MQGQNEESQGTAKTSIGAARNKLTTGGSSVTLCVVTADFPRGLLIKNFYESGCLEIHIKIPIITCRERSKRMFTKVLSIIAFG